MVLRLDDILYIGMSSDPAVQNSVTFDAANTDVIAMRMKRFLGP